MKCHKCALRNSFCDDNAHHFRDDGSVTISLARCQLPSFVLQRASECILKQLNFKTADKLLLVGGEAVILVINLSLSCRSLMP